MAAIVTEATGITEDDFLTASITLSRQVTAEDLAVGSIYPAMDDIRQVSLHIAADGALNIVLDGRSANKKYCQSNLNHNQTMQSTSAISLEMMYELCKQHTYTPKYNNYC